MGRERAATEGMKMVKITRTKTVAKEEVIISWSLWGQIGWLRFGCAAKK